MTRFRRSDSVRLVSPHLRHATRYVVEAKTLRATTPPRPHVRARQGSTLPASQSSGRYRVVVQTMAVGDGMGDVSQVRSSYEDSATLDVTPLARRGVRRAVVTHRKMRTAAAAKKTATSLPRGRHKAGVVTRTASTVSRVATVTAKKIVAIVMVKIAPISLAVIAGIAGIAGIVSVLPAWVIGYEETKQWNTTSVPSPYSAWVIEAGSICPEVTPSIIAAQIESESGWNPHAVSPVGAQGISQFMPATWASVGRDGDGDGLADPFNPADAIISQGHYMCGQVDQIERYFGQRNLDYALAAYNAGLGSVIAARGIPPFPETQNYVTKINTLAATKYATITAGMAGDDYPWAHHVRDGNGVVGGLYNTPNYSTRYYYGNCTDFVFWRVNRDMGVTYQGDLTRWKLTYNDLTPRGGNGYQWGKPGNLPGWETITRARDVHPGDIISYERGVLGASTSYGHVAYIAEVGPDGSVMTENYGLGLYWTRAHDPDTLNQLLATGSVVIKRNPAIGQSHD